jgi:acyl-CoA thioester hydrolase
MYHFLEIRVAYADTDQMGMAYYSNYLVWFERGRTEWLREAGLAYAEIEKEGVYLPVLEAYCNYKKSARYDDMVRVVTWLPVVPRSVLTVEYEIKRDDTLLAFGYTKHAFINKDGRPVKPPKSVLDRLAQLVERRSNIC